MNRRKFLRAATLFGVPILHSGSAIASGFPRDGVPAAGDGKSQVVVSTWNFPDANEAAYGVLSRGGSPLDAVETGIRVTEADPSITSVGIGGFPDRDGHLTLDASIMDGSGSCGSVVFMEGIDHPISVARLVMEKTPHVILGGEGATRFAVGNGFVNKVALTEQARKAYDEWLASGGYKPGTPAVINEQNHDTLGMLVLKDGRMAGGCSTSGAAWKMHGRVGDSPIVGAGLFVDDEVGAATATGLGETVIRIAGTALIVELMRQGIDPEEACRRAVRRIIAKQPQHRNDGGFLAGFLALRNDGLVGACCYRPGFEYAVIRNDGKTVYKSSFLEK